jgi:uncharacterized protein HemY
MDTTNPHIRAISDAIAQRRLVPVVGAGVASSTARLPGWVRLVESGLDYVAGVGTHQPEQIAEVRQLLVGGETIGAAQGLKALLHALGGEYRLWLRQTFRNAPDQVVSDRLIGAIRRLSCPLIATTNYDKLLSLLHMPTLEVVTWRSPALMHDALTEGDAVLHLHGVFDDPASVIFGEDDYNTIVREAPAYRDVLRTLWLDRTLLFIGCSFEGIEDPDFLNLLKWSAETFPDTAHKHYALVRNDSINPEVVARFLHDWRIQVVGYGDNYDDLAPFIESLNPNHDQITLTASVTASGQQRPVVSGPEVLQLVRDREALQIRATTTHERYLHTQIEQLRGLLNGGYTARAQEGLTRLIEEVERLEHAGAAGEMHGRVYLLVANAFMPVLSGGDLARAEDYLSKARALLSSAKALVGCVVAEARILSLTSRKEEALALLAAQSHTDAKRIAFTIHLDSGDLAACAAIIDELSSSGALETDDWHRLLATYYAETGEAAKATAIIDKMVVKRDAADFSTAASVLFRLAYREYFAACHAHHICLEAHFAPDLGLDELIDRTLEQRAIEMYERAADAYVSYDCLPEAVREILNALRLDAGDKSAELVQRLERLEPDSAYLLTARASGVEGAGGDGDEQMERLREVAGSAAPDTSAILDLASALDGRAHHAPAVVELLEANTQHFRTSDDTYVRYLYVMSRLYPLVHTPAETESWLSGMELPEQYSHLKAVFHILFYSQHDPANTAEWVEAALREYPDRPEVLKLGMYYYGQIADDQEKALACALSLFGVLRTGRMASLVLEYLLTMQKFQEIIAFAEENADLPIDERVLHRGLGRAHSAESHPVEARQHLEWLRQSGDANLGDLLTLATNCVYLGDLDEAVTIMNDAVARYPDEPSTHLMLSDVYAQRGDANESYRVALDAYRRFPDSP